MSNLPPPPGAPGSPSSGAPSGDTSGPALWSPTGGPTSPGTTLPPLPPPGWGNTGPTNGWGPGAIAPQAPPEKATSRFGDGVLVGLAAAAAAGGLWWAVVAFTGYQFVYGAIAVGLLVGHGVLIGARRGGPIFGVLAAVFTLASLAVAEYFIQRSLAISEEGYDIPLWTDFGFATDVVREALRGHAATGLFWGIAALVALVTAGSSNRRPSV